MDNFLQKGIKVLKNKKKRTIILAQHGFFRSMSDETFLKMQFKNVFGRNLNLDDPISFSEKLQWIKLYDRNPEYSMMVDKYAVKEYVARIIGEEHIINTIGVWEKFDDIGFHKLPNQFVLKCTHDSGGLIICTDKSKLNINKARKKIEKWLSNDYYIQNREWPYKNVLKRIVAEEYMVDDESKDLKDYKFFCFNGKVKCFKVDFDRFTGHRANYYDEKCVMLPFGEIECPPDYERCIKIPKSIDEMIRFAELLSNNKSFVRIDFYDVNGKVFFGEITFFPASGLGRFTSDEWDKKLGGWITLPKKNIQN